MASISVVIKTLTPANNTVSPERPGHLLDGPPPPDCRRRQSVMTFPQRIKSWIMAKACICVALLLVFPFLTLGETVGGKQPCVYPTVESVASDLGIGECVFDENIDEESKSSVCVNSCVVRLRSTEGTPKRNCAVELQACQQDRAVKDFQQKVSIYFVLYDRDAKVGCSKSSFNLRFERGQPSVTTISSELPGEIAGNRLAVLVVEEPAPVRGSRPISVLAFQLLIVRTEK